MIQIENRVVTSLQDVHKALKESPQGAKRVYINRNGIIMLLVAN